MCAAGVFAPQQPCRPEQQGERQHHHAVSGNIGRRLLGIWNTAGPGRLHQSDDDAADEGAFGLSGGQSDERASDPAAGATDRAAPPRVTSVTVQPGNTLWALASETYGDGFQYVRLFDANKDQIRDPDLIYPGQVFVLPQ